jgi:hypothetical protein
MSIPTITGTVGGQNVAVGGTIDPFSSATAVDTNSENLGGTNTGPDFVSPIVTISLSGSGGSLTNNDSATTLSNDGNNTYTLTVNDPAVDTQTNDGTFNQAFQGLQFIPGSGGTTTFSLYDTDKYGENTTDNTTTVTASGSGSPASAATTATSTPAAVISSSSNDQTISGGGTATVDNDSVLTISQPSSFQGSVALNSGVIDLTGLAAAASTSFANDILSIYDSSGNTIDQLTLASNSAAFTVENTGSGVQIYTGDDTRHAAGTALPYPGSN